MESMMAGEPLLWGNGVLLAGGLLWAAVCAVLLAMRWKVPAVVATAPLLLHGAYVATAAMWVTRESARFGSDPAMSATLGARAVVTQLALGSAAISAMPVAVVLLFGGVAAGVRGRRAFGAPAFALLLGLVVAALPLAGLAQHASLASALVRAALYALLALPTAAALAGAHPQDNSREGALVATVSFATLVMSVELLDLSQQWSKVFNAVALIAPESRKELIQAGIAEVAGLGTLAWVGFALAGATAVIALLRPAADLTDEEVLAGNVSPSGLRWFGGAAALLVLVAWAAARLATDPSALLLSFAP